MRFTARKSMVMSHRKASEKTNNDSMRVCGVKMQKSNRVQMWPSTTSPLTRSKASFSLCFRPSFFVFFIFRGRVEVTSIAVESSPLMDIIRGTAVCLSIEDEVTLVATCGGLSFPLPFSCHGIRGKESSIESMGSTLTGISVTSTISMSDDSISMSFEPIPSSCTTSSSITIVLCSSFLDSGGIDGSMTGGSRYIGLSCPPDLTKPQTTLAWS